MNQTLLKSWLLMLLMLVGVVSAKAEKYTLTINTGDFNSSSYAANNNEKTTDAVSMTDATKTYEVKWASNQVMKQSDVMQWQKSKGCIYNNTDLGTIESVTVTSTDGSFTTYYGSSAQPSSSTTVGGGYFQVKVGGATGKTSSVEVVFTINEGDSRPSVSLSFSPTSLTTYLGEAFTAPTLTADPAEALSAVAYASSTPSVASVASNGVVTLAAAGTTTITAAISGSTAYKDAEASYNLTVVDPNAPGQKNNPYTVAQALAAIDAGIGVTGVYATGIVSEIVTAYSSQYGNISYNISADGTTSGSQLQAYRGFSYNGEKFTSSEDIQKGDVVVIYGNLTKYKTTYEFAQDNQLVSLTRPVQKLSPELAYTTTSYTIIEGESFTSPALTNPHNLAVTYASSKSAVADVDATTGAVTINGVGTATITASYAGDDTYSSGSASYTITVNAAPQPCVSVDENGNVTFNLSENGWGFPTSKETEEASFTNSGYTIKLMGSTGNGYAYYSSGSYLLFGKKDAYLQLPAFTFDVEKIEVVGRSGASGIVLQNIFVGEEAVSTETTGATGTNVYEIAEAYQAAGNVYVLKVTSAHNTQVTSIKVYKKAAAVVPDPVDPEPETPAIPDNVKFQAQVKSGTIDVTARIFNDYTAELTLPQDDQYIGHDVTVSMGFYGATGLGINTGESRSFTISKDLTPYVKSYIGQVITEGMVNDLIAQVKDDLTAEQVASLLDEYETNMGESEVNKIIDNATVTAEMVGKILPNPLTKADVDNLLAEFSVTLTGDEAQAYNNWSSLTSAEQTEALTEIRAKILEAIQGKISTVQDELKAKAKAMDAALRKSMIVDYLESLSADEKKTHVIDYINGLGASERKEMVLDYINSMSNDNLAALIDQVAASMHLNAQTLLEKACEFAGVGTAWISEVMNPIYGFNQTAVNVKVVDERKESTGFKYTVKGDSPSTKNTKITAEPDDLAKAQAAWSMVADHMQGTTQTIEDNKMKIVKGTYVQFGDQRLKFIKDLNLFEGGMNWTLSKENLVNNATEIYASILDAVEIENTNMETTDAANTYIVAAYMPKGSDIHVGSSVLTLKDNCRVELDAKEAAAQAPEASEALSQEITEVRNLILNSVGKREKVKAVAHYGLAMFTRAFAIADGRELDLRIIFAPDCDVNRDGRVTADDVPALVNNILGKDADNKNDHETNIDGGESDVQSLGDLTKLINVLKTLGAITAPATSETPEP